MRRIGIALLAFASLGQAPAHKGGTVTGTVAAVEKGETVKSDELYVYLEMTKFRSQQGKDFSAQIVQKDTKFTPHIAVIPVGGTVFFPNLDSQEHNVFAPSVKANDFIGFDLGRYNTNKTGRHQRFLEAGEFDIYCDIHKEMWAKVKVVPSRYIVPVVDGKYTFTDVPPGTYTVVAWAPDSTEMKSAKPITVADGTTNVDLLKVRLGKHPGEHLRKDGTPYSAYPAK